VLEVSLFPAPATSNCSCGFPASSFPMRFMTRVMQRIGRERLPVCNSARGSLDRDPACDRATTAACSSSPMGPKDYTQRSEKCSERQRCCGDVNGTNWASSAS
jgi:hypothetical protein